MTDANIRRLEEQLVHVKAGQRKSDLASKERTKLAQTLRHQIDAWAFKKSDTLTKKILALEESSFEVERPVGHTPLEKSRNLRVSRVVRFKEVRHDFHLDDKTRDKYTKVKSQIGELSIELARIKRIAATEIESLELTPELTQVILAKIIRYKELTKQIETPMAARAREAQIISIERELAELRGTAAAPKSGNRNASQKGQPQRVVLQWSDAEELAKDYLVWLGVKGARTTPGGADGGIDVEAPTAVAQVKMHNKPVGRPDVQQLFGIASAEGKKPYFFAMAFSKEAIEWAKKVGMRMFEFKRDGSVVEVT